MCCACGVPLSEGRKEGRKKEKKKKVPECVVHSCRSVCVCVCLWSHTVFCAWRSLCVTSRLQKLQRAPSPRAWHTVSLCADQLPSTAHTLGVVFGRTAECCVRHSRAGRMSAQNAVLPHSHGEGPNVSRFTGLSSQAVGGTAAVFQCQGSMFSRYCRESQGSSRYCRSP